MNLNLNLSFAKSMNLNLFFSKSMNLNLNLKIKNIVNGSNQCSRYGKAGGPCAPNGRLCSHFGLPKILLLEHHATIRQQTMMEKEPIALKHNSLLMFSRFFAKYAGNEMLYTGA